MNVEQMLREEIQDELKLLGAMGPGADEHTKATEDVVKLMDRYIDLKKVNLETQEKHKVLEDEQKDRLIKNCIAVAGIAIPAVLTIWGTLKSFEFEKEGTVTTIMGRGFINKLLPRK